MRIVFMGTPDFARDSLDAIYNAGHEVLAVVTNIDKPKGRGMKMIYTPVKEFALEKNIEILQPERIKGNQEFINKLKSLNPDVLCVVAYGKILPKDVLDIPKYGAINVHASLLPKYRGSAPIQWAVINGDNETGVCTMYMDEGMDTGDIILEEKTKIDDNETTGELWNRLSRIGANLLVETLEKIKEGIVDRKKQGDNYTMAPMLTKEMGNIDWKKSATEIKNLVRGLNPIIGAYTFYNGRKIKIWKVEIENNIEDINAKPGQIILADNKKGLFIKTGNGILSILEIQADNSKKMDIKSFLNGTNLESNVILNKNE